MKSLCSLFLMLLVMCACRPHYDFSKIRTEIREESKTDSLVYQTTFPVTDPGWQRAESKGQGTDPEAGGFVLTAESAGKTTTQLAPCGMLRYSYTLLTKVKIQVQDSTDLGYAGLCFDRIDTSYYRVLFISNKGTFYLKSVCNAEEELLIPKIPSRYLYKGSNVANTIEIRHRRKEVRILFNGNVAAICKLNAAFSYGAAGLTTASEENKIRFSPVKAVFESFALKKIKSAKGAD